MSRAVRMCATYGFGSTKEGHEYKTCVEEGRAQEKRLDE